MQADDQLKRAAAAARLLRKRKLRFCFSADDLESRPTEAQDDVLRDCGKLTYRYVSGGNRSGKTQLPAREISWILRDEHPHWTRPGPDMCPQCGSTEVTPGKANRSYLCDNGHNWADWTGDPLVILIAGQDKKQMEIELWEGKLAKFLNTDEWRIVRQNTIQYIQHKTEGHIIVFLSHSDSSEKNRKHMQGYTAHYVWIDEMPTHPNILEELERRVDSKKGYLIGTFTMKVRNPKISQRLKNLDPSIGKRYYLSKLDNPVFADRIDEEMAKLEGYSEAKKRNILYGEEMPPGSLIYEIVPDKHLAPLPDHYHPGWRHVLSVDPATESKLGMTVWAEDPVSGVWWLVQDDYVEGIYVPTKIIEEVERRVKGFNVVRRIYDSAESWYKHQASAMGYIYMPVENKANRKDEMRRNLQQLLGNRLMLGEHCSNLFNELTDMERSETNPDKIVAENTYHAHDTAIYFADNIPVYIPNQEAMSWQQRLWAGNEERKRKNEQAKKAQSQSAVRKKHIVKSTIKKKRWI